MTYSASRIFDGDTWRSGTIETSDGIITAITEAAAQRRFDGCTIVPAFVDIQIYGAGGRLLAEYPDAESLRVLAEENLKGGTAVCQPTIATNTLEVIQAAIGAVRAYWAQGGEGIAGLHVEGPWISSKRRGAHPEQYIHSPSVVEVRQLLETGRGIIRTITLAPEVCSDEVLQLLKEEGIVLFAGHSDMGFGEATDAFSHRGITGVTHLFNAMSPLHHRAPGLVGAAFAHDRVLASIIPDGIHVDFEAVKIAHRMMKGRLFAITDAVTETHSGLYHHTLTEGTHYTCNGTLSGSAISMNDAFRMLHQRAAIDVGEALRMCGALPAQAIGLERFGTIKPGAAAAFLVYDDAWALKEVISEPGSRSPSACGARHI